MHGQLVGVSIFSGGWVDVSISIDAIYREIKGLVANLETPSKLK